MDASKEQKLTLQRMPYDILCVIVSRVGAVSSVDYANTIITCKDLHMTHDNPIVSKHLHLSPFVNNPGLALEDQGIFQRCLAVNNPAAHYVKGMLFYFHMKEKFLGLHHLQVAYVGGHKEATYLFGVIHMCLGITDKGRKVMAKLIKEENLRSIKTCWASIKISMANIHTSNKKVYLRSMEAMKPGENCHVPEMENSCKTCINYDIMCKFVYFIMEMNPTQT